MSEDIKIEEMDDEKCSICWMIATHSPQHYDEWHHNLHSNCDSCPISQTTNNPSLCSICNHMRIPHLVRCHRHYGLGSRLKIYRAFFSEFLARASECGFCQLIVDGALTIKETWCLDNDHLKKKEIWLAMYPGKMTISIGNNFVHCLPLTLWKPSTQSDPPEQIGSAVPPFKWKYGTIPILDKFIKWDEVSAWLNASVGANQNPSRLHMPEKLKVIDVHHDRVVDAPPDCQYLTLSYVFGHVTRLEIPSSGCFDRHQLPATIRDALIACQNVGFQFLWVDQICIDQKNEVELQTQINQMSHIYRAATCTLVALAGEDSLYGLPGVSRGRTWKQNTVKLDERLVVQLTPPMDVCLENSKWATRGWTFQEDLFSSRLIFFSEVGLFYNDRLVESSSNVLSEDGCHSTCWAHLPSLLLYWDVLAFYTRRKLSYPSDAVRAFTAILHEVHGRNGTYYGLPLQYFDQGVLWIPQNPTLPSTERHTQFPSWSWASHDGDITHINAGTPLAVWAKPEVTGSTVNMRICRPVSGAEWEPRWGDCRGRLANIYAAWTAGCIPSLLPETFSRLLSTQSPFSTRLWGDMPFITTLEGPSLKDLWPTYHAFWEEALGAQIHDDLFPTDHLKHLPSLDGLIATHSQVAYFDVRPPTEKLIMKDGSRTFRVQSPTGALSGAIRIPEYLQSPSVPCRGEFLLLSITEEAYTDVVNLLSVEDDHRIEHVVHDRTLRQCDRYGEKGHDRETMVNVMLISRSGNHDIARRVGVGQIFLKSWAEAERQFKSIFLQ